MIKLNTEPATKKYSYENPELLDCYPDIDYEMIPIQDEQNTFQIKENLFDLRQLSASSFKNLLKNAEQLEFVDNPDIKNGESESDIIGFTNESDGKGLSITLKNDLSVFLPIDQISKCKKSTKFTKIYLIDGQILKTSVSFKKLKKGLLEYGFKEYQKSRLVRNKLKLRFPKSVNP